jgi:hypothetical protein
VVIVANCYWKSIGNNHFILIRSSVIASPCLHIALVSISGLGKQLRFPSSALRLSVHHVWGDYMQNYEMDNCKPQPRTAKCPRFVNVNKYHSQYYAVTEHGMGGGTGK